MKILILVLLTTVLILPQGGRKMLYYYYTPNNVVAVDTGLVLLDSLKAYWNMSSVNDSYSTNTLTNSGVSFVSGKVGNCGDFESSESDYMRLAEASAGAVDYNGNVDFTFAAWFNLETADTYQAIIGKGATVTTRQYFLLAYNQEATPDAPTFGVSNSGTATTSASGGSQPSTGTWYFIAAWHNATTDSIYIQVNNGTVYKTAFSSGLYNSSSDFEIGRYLNGTLKYDGLIDEVATWKRVLTVGERTYLYNNGTGRTYTGGKIQ